MQDIKQDKERLIMKKVKKLPPEQRSEVIDFIEFLEIRQKMEKWVEFDEWALNLAKKKGFSKLTEEDVVRILNDHRRVR